MFKSFDEIIEDLKHDDPRIRQEAVYLLGKEETQEAADLLADALSDSDKQVQFLAMKSLSRLKFLGIRPAKALPAQATPPQPTAAKPAGAPPVRLTISPISPVAPPVPPAPTAGKPPVQTPARTSTAAVPKPAAGSAPSAPPPAAPVFTPPTQTAVSASTRSDNPDSSATLPRTPTAIVSPASVERASPPPSSVPTAASSAAATSKSPLPSSPAAAISETSSDNDLPNEQPVQIPVPPKAPSAWLALVGCPQENFTVWFQGLEQRKRVDVLTRLEAVPSDPGLVQALGVILASETDIFVLSKAVKVYGKQAGAGSLARLELFLDHADTRVIANTLEALGISGGQKELQKLSQFLDHPDSRTRSTAAKHLWGAHPDKAMAVIERMCRSAVVWEREAARHALKSCPLPRAQELLKQLDNKPTTTAVPAAVPSEPLPAWRIWLDKPVEIGLDKPLKLWEFLIFVGGLVAFGNFIALPVVDWLFPLAN